MEINMKNIEVFLQKNHILKELNLHVKNKEFVGIIGPNGSGKSTLLKCIYRILSPNKGDIFINEKNINKYKISKTAKMMAVVSQHNDNHFDFTVLDMVLLGRSPHKKFLDRDNNMDYKIAYDSLEKVGMKDFAKRGFSTLSGGERQRIILARALAQQTECLILDEPTNHLDISHKLNIMKIVKKLNLTVVSAIHDLNIASLYCDKIYALKDGNVIAFGSPEEVLTERIIKELYGIECKIVKDRDIKALNIIFKP